MTTPIGLCPSCGRHYPPEMGFCSFCYEPSFVTGLRFGPQRLWSVRTGQFGKSFRPPEWFGLRKKRGV
jgi:hypothetical protein